MHGTAVQADGLRELSLAIRAHGVGLEDIEGLLAAEAFP